MRRMTAAAARAAALSPDVLPFDLAACPVPVRSDT
jgi:thymidine kinase